MKTYSDLLDTSSELEIILSLNTIGDPDYTVSLNGISFNDKKISYLSPLLDPVVLEIELKNKVYTLDYETAIVIESLTIDNIPVLPKFDYLATYINDHQYNDPTSYLGFNGKWKLSISKPFYHWLHEIKGQGWLLA